MPRSASPTRGRGRPPLPPGEAHARRAFVCLTPSEYEEARSLAAEAGVSLSKWIRLLVFEAVIKDRAGVS